MLAQRMFSKNEKNAKGTTLAVKSISTPDVTASTGAFITLEMWSQRDRKDIPTEPTRQKFCSQKLHEVRTLVPFQKFVTKFSKKDSVLNEHMCIVSGTRPPASIMVSEWKWGIGGTPDVNPLPYREAKDQRTKIELPIKVENENPEIKVHDWLDHVKIYA